MTTWRCGTCGRREEGRFEVCEGCGGADCRPAPASSAAARSPRRAGPARSQAEAAEPTAKVVGDAWRCGTCGRRDPARFEICPSCGGADCRRVAAAKAAQARRPAAAVGAGDPDGSRDITSIKGKDPPRIPLRSMPNVCRVLGGSGFVIGSVILITGEPGSGKSTLLMQWIAAVARFYRNRPGVALYATGEEAAEMVGMRAQRLNDAVKGLRVLATNSTKSVKAAIARWRPKFLIMDSVQTFSEEEDGSGAGTIRQIKSVLRAMRKICADHGITLVLVCHITKGGDAGGPKELEHMVDVYMRLEGERTSPVRVLSAPKNRFGGAGDMAVLEHTSEGLREVADPADQILRQRADDEAGSVIYPSAELARPTLVEVAVMVTGGPKKNEAGDIVDSPSPHVASISGLPSDRMPRLLNLLRDGGPELRGTKIDLELNAAPGVVLTETPLDLAVAMAIVSSATDRVVPPDTVVMGTVSVSGRLKAVPRCLARLELAQAAGFTRALVPEENFRQGEYPKLNFKAVPIHHVRDLMPWLLTNGFRPKHPRRELLELVGAPKAVPAGPTSDTATLPATGAATEALTSAPVT
jgi:DNA repair protein RadA/Sms